MSKLSVFYIVRNEEALIGQSVESVLPIADEVIFVDTGSVDKTIQICSKMPKAKVHSYAWSDDFSQARNYAMRLCEGPWILYLDADERLDERARRAIKSAMLTKVGGALLKIVDHVGQWTSVPESASFFDSPQLRLFRKDQRVSFQGRVIESVAPSIQRSNLPVNLLEGEIHHFLWRGKNDESAAGRLRYYNKLGANFSLLDVQARKERTMPEEPQRPLADVAVVITAFGALEYTRQAVSSAVSNAHCPMSLYLVDNGSRDGTYDYFSQVKDATVMRLHENQGVARGKNVGLQEALKNDGLQYVVFLDNDVIMPERWLAKMREVMDSRPEVGILSPISRLSLMQGQHPESISKYLMRISLAELNKTGFGRPVDFEPAELVDGTCMMVRAQVARKLGMFDSSFGLYGYEDFDYCLRAKKEGYQVGRASRVFFEHFGGASKRSIALDWHSISTTARVRFQDKWRAKPNVGPSPVIPVASHLGKPIPVDAKEDVKVSIVIIAHNRLDMTKDCLTSIRASTKSYELVFVDNGSTDGTVEWVSKNFPQAKLIKNAKNEGIPKARNQGLKETTNDLIVVMDNDCVVSQGWIDDLLVPLDKGFSVSGIEAWYLNGAMMPTGKALIAASDFGYLGGACCLFRRELFEEVGLLDEGYSPAYYEDSLSGDRCIPIRKNGQVEVVSLEDLFSLGEKIVRKDGKEESLLSDVETLTVDPQNPSVEIDPENPPSWWTNRYLSQNERTHLDKHRHGENTRYFIDVVKSRIKKKIKRYYNEDAQAFWTPIKTVVRHKCNKNMFRIDGKFGQTCCTEDHSLMIWNEGHLSEATPSELADKRLCSVSCKVETDVKSYCTLPICGQWNKDGSDAVLRSKLMEYRIPTYNGVVGFAYDDYRARDIFRFLGYYVSEGSCSGCNVSLSVYDKELAKRIAASASSFFGKEMEIHEYEVGDTKREIRGVKFNVNKNTCYRVNFYKKQIADMLLEICGKGAHGKKIPSFVYSAPEVLKREFLAGMIEGDGHYFRGSCKSERSYSDEYRLKAFKYETVSPVLASGLCLLMATMDERFSVQFNEKKGSYSINYVQFRKNSRQKIRVTPLGQTNDFVYDIAVEGTHTFVDALGLLVVHNTDWCVRAKKLGHKLAHIPTPKIKHREHATLIGTQKDFHYQNALNKSGERYGAVMRGEIKPVYERLPRLQKKLRILYLGMQWDYGEKSRGTSFEHDNFYPSLLSWDKVGELKHFDFVEIANQHGVAKMCEALKRTVDDFKPDALFSVFFEPNHDPTKSVMKSISETTSCKTINWFCDSHYRYENFDSKWAPYLDYCVTTSSVAYNRYKNDGFGSKVIKSQWFASPSYRKIEDIEKDVPVSFVGQPHGDRKSVIQYLLTQGVKCDCFGHGWGKRLSFSEMVEMFNRTRINLNLNNAADARFKQIKGRNFEVPACGGFLLTGNSENLSEYYHPGKEIVIFEGTHDLSEKIKHYLRYEVEREAIAKAGYERTTREHTASHRLDAIFSKAGLL